MSVQVFFASLQRSRLASFPGSSAPEREIELVHACTIRVPESLGTRLVHGHMTYAESRSGTRLSNVRSGNGTTTRYARDDKGGNTPRIESAVQLLQPFFFVLPE